MLEILTLSALVSVFLYSNFIVVILQLEFIGVVENLESLLIGIFSIVLLLLSITTYKKTGLKNILFAATAFALFTFQVFLELVIERYYSVTYPMQDLLNTSITLAILSLFFLSVVRAAR
ncbi:MAG TPA: hypothetical protein VD815_06660 [Candidatus Saccharimonadales bacterium]|nr:hypothetical protein [Candidatus Saccharimonadales bacterium]